MKILFTLLLTCIISYSYSQNWDQKGDFVLSEDPGDFFGTSVDMSSNGETIIVGAPRNNGAGAESGHIRMYDWIDNGWLQRGFDINGAVAGDRFGSAVAISADGNTVAASAPENDDNGNRSGKVRVYNWNGIFWTQRGSDIDGIAAETQMARSLAFANNGDILAMGVPLNDQQGVNKGLIRVYEWNGTDYIQRGSDMFGEEDNDEFGDDIAITPDGNALIAGSQYNDGSAPSAGHARAYIWNGSDYEQRGDDIDGEEVSDNFGSAVDISADGNTIAIGGRDNNDGGINAGHVRVYEWLDTFWWFKGDEIDGEIPWSAAGVDLALSEDGNRVAIGESGYDGSGQTNFIGRVRIMDWNGTAWSQATETIDGQIVGNGFGQNLAMNPGGTHIIVGDANYDIPFDNSGRASVYELYVCQNTSNEFSINSCDSFSLPSGQASVFESGIYMDTIANVGGCDSILTINVTINSSTMGATQVVESCEPYEWTNGMTYSSSGLYTDVLTNAAGCDSTISLDITITEISASIEAAGYTLYASPTGTSYQWIDCDNDNLPIPGATDEYYEVQSTGNYAVEITENNCSDISDCLFVNFTGIEDFVRSPTIKVYPNPSKDFIQFEFPGNLDPIQFEIEILSLTGRQLMKNQGSSHLDLRAFSPGLYILRVRHISSGKQWQNRIEKTGDN